MENSFSNLLKSGNVFRIKNKGVSPGIMSYLSEKEFKEGYLCQLLSNESDYYNETKGTYDTELSQNVAWVVEPCTLPEYSNENVYFIKNSSKENAYLAKASTESPSGYFAVILDSSFYNDNKNYKVPKTPEFESLLWKIELEENETFIIKNFSIKNGELSWSWKKSESGRCCQVLYYQNGNYSRDCREGYYNKSGCFYIHILWQFIPVIASDDL